MAYINILKDALSQIFGKFLTIALTFITVKIMSTYGATFYGQYVASYDFIAFFGILADAGLFALCVREMAKDASKQQFIFGNIWSLRLILVIIMCALAAFTAQIFPNMSDTVRMGTVITSVSMALTVLSATLSAPLQVASKVHLHAIATVIGKVIFVALVVMIWYNPSLFGTAPFYLFLFAGLIGNVIGLIGTALPVMKTLSLKPLFNTQYMKAILTESLPYGIALILQTLYFRIDIIIILALLGEYAVGLYGIPARILESMLAMSVFFGRALLTPLAQSKTSEEASTILSWALHIVLLITIPIIIYTIFLAPDIVLFMSSKDFLEPLYNMPNSATLLSISIITIVPAFLCQTITMALITSKEQHYLMYINLIALIINALGNYIFIPLYGLIAASVFTVISEFIVLFMTIYKARTYYTYSIHKPLLYTLVLISIAFIALFLAPSLPYNFIIKSIIAGIIYICIIFMFAKKHITRPL